MLNSQHETGTYAPAAGRPIALAPIPRVATECRPALSVNVIAPKHCGACAMRKVCVPSEMSDPDLARFEDYLHVRRRIRTGQHLYRAGDVCHSLYAIRSGFIRTSTVSDDGREQVTGFHMMGEVIGIDMIGGGIHGSDAVALEDTEVCELSLSSLSSMASDIPGFQRKLYRMIGEEFVHEREAMLLLGSMRAEDRVALFLLDIGRRYSSRGFSALRFVLRMSRADIGSYLGLRLETVSRVFSRFQAESLLRVDGKSVAILDLARLKLVIGRGLN
jgi:CRP/FNR family transcriptional regulator